MCHFMYLIGNRSIFEDYVQLHCRESWAEFNIFIESFCIGNLTVST